MQQYTSHPKTRNFAPRPKVAPRIYNPPIMKPNTDRELNVLIHVRDWHACRTELKEDGKRHREMVRRINIVIEDYDG